MAVILAPSTFLTSSPLSNQCIYFLNHLNPAPFSLSHHHGCGPGHHHLSPRSLPGSGKSLATQDPNPTLHPSHQSQRKKHPVFIMSVPIPLYHNPTCPLLIGHGSNSSAQDLGFSSERGENMELKEMACREGEFSGEFHFKWFLVFL